MIVVFMHLSRSLTCQIMLYTFTCNNPGHDIKRPGKYLFSNKVHFWFVGGHPLSTYAKFSEKLTFLTPWYVHVRVRIRGLEMLVFRKIVEERRMLAIITKNNKYLNSILFFNFLKSNSVLKVLFALIPINKKLE